jgi:hypothetical protein
MVASNNPNETSGSANARVSNLSFPVGEMLTKRTVLRFEQYNRETPSSSINSNTTAIINLPMPMQIPDNMSMKSGAVDMDFTENVGALYEAASGTSVADLKAKIGGVFNGNTNKNLARAAALVPAIVSDDRRTAASIVGGVVKNPHTTAFFDGVNLRGYFLNWRFSPRSQQESDELKRIIDTIRERIHPAETLGGYALDYPDLVYVDFEGESKEYLPKFYRSFISEVTVNSSVGEGMAFYKSGAPIVVELGLRLNETNIVTRDVLSRGSF